MPESLPPTPHADVNEALGDMLAQVQTILGPHFMGMYLSGSLAVGDFDPASSDIDLVVVTGGPLPAERFAALREMHARWATSGAPWAAKLEAVYIPQDTLRHGAPAGARYPVLERSRALALDRLEDAWSVQRFTFREHGVAVAGAAPGTLLDPVDPDDMRREGAAIAEMWLDQARTDPSWLAWLREPKNQAFVVLTLCRLLYTLESGAVASKPAAARWAQQGAARRWAGLIARALAGQHDPADISTSEEQETLAFIAYAVDRFRQWATPLAAQDGARNG